MASRGAGFAVLGGVIGALIWGAVAYTTGWSFGFVAIGVGALVGFGMILGSKARGTVGSGLGAAMIALGCIVGAKFVVAELEAGDWMREAGKVSDLDAIDQYASEVYDYFAASGQHMSAAGPEGWPPEVYSEAKRLWTETPLVERDEYMLAMGRDARRHAEESRFQVGVAAFVAGFGPVNLVIIGLAAATAYKTGRWNKEEQAFASQSQAARPPMHSGSGATGGITAGPLSRAQPAGGVAPAAAAPAKPKKKGKKGDDDEDHHSAGIFARLGHDEAPKVPAAAPAPAAEKREAA